MFHNVCRSTRTFLAKLIIDNCLSVSVCFFFLTFLKIKLKVTNNNKGKKEVDYEKEVSTNSFCTLALRVATKVSFYLLFEYWFKICVSIYVMCCYYLRN